MSATAAVENNTTSIAPDRRPQLSRDRLSHIQLLEAESIHIFREVASEFQNPVMLYSIGKDSSVMLRLAFGASVRDVAALVIAQGMKPTLVGIAMGLGAALALGRVAASLIYGVSARDLATFSSATLVIVLISFAASLVPALRATRVDPLKVLREE